VSLDVLRRTFQPADRTIAETTSLFDVAKGRRVLFASAQKLVKAAAGTTSTMMLGDGLDPDGYVTGTDGGIGDLDLETGSAGDLVTGTGAYLDSSGGKLHTVHDTVDVVYTPGATPGATTPRVAFVVVVLPEWAGL